MSNELQARIEAHNAKVKSFLESTRFITVDVNSLPDDIKATLSRNVAVLMAN